MKKNGFTLAEILIALCIIGIISALTVPNVSKLTTDAKIGPSLSKFVADFSHATGVYLLEEDAYTLTDAGAANGDLKWLQNYMNLIPAGTSGDNNPVYILPNGSTVAIIAENTSYTAKAPYKGEFAQIVYDIDGKQGKNTVGRDIFQFFLDESGALIPYGSKASEYLMPNIETGCEAYNAACTGAIADNNYTTKGIAAYNKYLQKNTQNNNPSNDQNIDSSSKIESEFKDLMDKYMQEKNSISNDNIQREYNTFKE